MTGVCFCLNAPASYGYSSGRTKPTIWGCTPEHLEKMRKVKRESMSEMQAKARAAGGQAAGAYLESLGQFDLSALTPEQWDQFLVTLLNAYRDELVRLNEPF